MTTAPLPPAPAAQRIDKWLWCARIMKTRSLATKLVTNGGVRLTRGGAAQRVEKASTLVRPGDSLSFMIGRKLRILEIRACGVRRGPASEAQTLYLDHSPSMSDKPADPDMVREPGAGRPTKKDRRALDRMRLGAKG